MIQCINSNCKNKTNCVRFNPSSGGVNFKQGLVTSGCEYFEPIEILNDSKKEMIEIQIGRETILAEKDFFDEPNNNIW